MTDFLTSSDIVSIEAELRQVDPKLLGDPAMLAAMAIRLDASDDDQAYVRARIANYIAFRWPEFRRDLTRSLAKGQLMGKLLQDVKRRTAKLN